MSRYRCLTEHPVLGPRSALDVALGPLTTYKVGGPADALVCVGSDRELDALVEACAEIDRASPLELLVVGRGSNLLVADAGWPGLAVVLDGQFEEYTIEAATVRAGGAVLLPVLARATVRAGLTGFEWAVGVPGSIGGAVAMNAGGHGSDMAASLRSVDIVRLGAGAGSSGADGRRTVPVDELDLAYRRSAVTACDLVVAAELELEPGDAEASAAVLSEIVRWRRAHQPGGQNAGSVFANPEGDSAGRLIEAAGLKGYRIGTAAVSTKHANFIQADPDGSADDVHHLIGHVQSVVADRFGVTLRPENRMVGRFAPTLGERGR